MSISSQDICEARATRAEKTTSLAIQAVAETLLGKSPVFQAQPLPGSMSIYWRVTYIQWESPWSNPRRQEPSPVGASGPRLNRTGAPKRLGVGWDDLLLGLNIG